MTDYRPLFPYFGGKSAISDKVWSAMGDIDNYVEPFFGSGAVLFMRTGGPDFGTETVNDADGFVANFWRAVKADPETVAEHADTPVNECDLHSRHLWLLGQRERITDRLCGDPEFFDAKSAGWWCWGLCCWIGSGWCAGKGPWQSIDGVMTDTRQLPHLGSAGQGVNRKRPHLGDAGQGVNRQPNLILEQVLWFSERLRNIRVCCGDWARVCGPAVTFKHGVTGVFLDPPYADTAGRDPNLYAVDCLSVAHDVREWAIEQGKNPLMRIVLAGYEGEHTMPDNWRKIEWQAHGGMANIGREGREGTGNFKKERMWCSPACVDPNDNGLFQTKELTINA